MSQPEYTMEELRGAVEKISDTLCTAVDGNFDFVVSSSLHDEMLEKLAMLVNFVLDAARRSVTDLESRNAALREVDRLKSDFVANVSHELRTPLTLILGPLESLLEDEGLRPETKDEVARIQRNAARLAILVNDLLDFSKVEAGKMDVQWRAVAVSRLVTQLADDVRPAAQGRGLELVAKIDDSVGNVALDPRLFEKIALNFLSNAMKFTPAGGRVELSLAAAGDDFELAVTDTGVGIAEDKLGLVFERFVQADASSTRAHEGTGIGLALVKEFAGLMGGRVGVESRPGEGSRFHVRLPRGADRVDVLAPDSTTLGSTLGIEPLAPARETGAARRSQAPEGAPLVLVAEDNVDMSAYIVSLLASEYEVAVAGNGRRALDAAKERRPDVIVSDVMMPEMDGFELVRRLKADPALRQVPIILLTARAGQGSVAGGLDQGADDYLCKPFGPDELVARVRAAWRGHELYQRLESQNGELARLQDQLRVTVEQLVDLEELALAGQKARSVSGSLRRLVADALEEAGTSTGGHPGSKGHLERIAALLEELPTADESANETGGRETQRA